jgi:hypothetical protein
MASLCQRRALGRNRDVELLTECATPASGSARQIFFIGFNKTATTSLAMLMAANGIRSAHWLKGRLAERIEDLHGQRFRLWLYLMRWTAYSDLTSVSASRVIEGNRHFRLFHGLFPRSYFVLNDREVEGWIASRAAHRRDDAFSHRRDSFLTRSSEALGTDEEGVKAIWRQAHADHVAAVCEYFGGHPRFLHFFVDRDPIDRLAELLRPDFDLETTHWQTVNSRLLRQVQP